VKSVLFGKKAGACSVNLANKLRIWLIIVNNRDEDCHKHQMQFVLSLFGRCDFT
jgi:hypothetical protein